jgi:hypothetical protein
VTRTTSKQQIIDQDNARLVALVEAYRTTRAYWRAANSSDDEMDAFCAMRDAADELAVIE